MKTNCWDETQCGREPGGAMTVNSEPCPVPLFVLADGFLGGNNGGRACTFVLGTLNEEERRRACAQSVDVCKRCSYYKKLKKKHKKSFREPLFQKFVLNASAR